MQALQETFMETRWVGMHSRRALLQTPLYHHPSAADGGGPGSSFDANVVMILAVLLCALICALGFNSIIRCTLRCSSRLAAGAELGAAAAARPGRGGMRRKALRSMPVLVYSAGLRLHAASPVCAVCLSDFEPGEHVRVLPKCNHGFHVRCVDRWLLARSTCPTCRQPLFGAPPKASGCAEEGRAGPDPARPVLAPLRPEGVATLYDF